MRGFKIGVQKHADLQAKRRVRKFEAVVNVVVGVRGVVALAGAYGRSDEVPNKR